MSLNPRNLRAKDSQGLRRDATAAPQVLDAEGRLRLFIEYVPAAVAMFDTGMRYLDVSRRWRTDYGLGDRDLRGLSHYAVFPEIGEGWQEVHRRALAGEVLRADCDRFVRIDGSVQWVKWEVRPWLDAKGVVGGIVIFTEDITAATQSAREARETAQWLELALHSAHAAVWEWDVHSNENIWSDDLYSLYGLEKGKVEPSYDAWRSIVLPEDRDEAERIVREASARGEDISFEFRVRAQDGSVRHLLSLARPVRNGSPEPTRYLGLVMDITERRRAEDVLRAHEREQAVREVVARSEATARVTADRLRSAVENIDDALVLFDDADRLVLCNEAYRKLLRNAVPNVEVGMTYSEILQAWSSEVSLDEADRARYRKETAARHAAGITPSFELRTHAGRVYRVTSRRTPEGGFVATIHDMTDDERRANELQRARAAAEAGSAAKSEFLSSMTHELRTPLNAILGFAQLLQRDRKVPLSERHKDRVEHILTSGEHLLRLIDDVLDLSRIESGGVAISIEPVEISDVLSSVKRSLGPLEARHGIEVELGALPPDVPCVAADRTRFVQIVTNFCSNALKYNRPGGTVRIEVTRPVPDRIRVCVHDTGVGIPESKRSALFHPFQRAGQEAGPVEGTGIGLVITRRLATMMGGDVGFTSTAGEGSSFWVDLPIAPESLRPSEREGPPASRYDRAEGERLVLYVEDNPANVAFMRDLIASVDGANLVTVSTARSAIDVACRRRPDVILMDINLDGDLDGFDALRMLRASDAADIPVIALTAAASERERERGLQAGFRAYLTKPVQVDALLAQLEPLLSPSRASGAPKA